MKLVNAIILFTFLCACNAISMSLNGNWEVILRFNNETSHPLNGNATTFNATVPGGIYTDLVRAGIIPENLISDNDVKNRWVSNTTLILIKRFEVNDTFLQATDTYITFHGIDTFAFLYINDCVGIYTSNMFVKYQYNIAGCLKSGINELRVQIDSPILTANKLYKAQSSNYVVPPECVPEIYNGECHVNHIRKMQASFSWDWGPAFPSMGIWKDVVLEAPNIISIARVTTDLYYKNNTWDIVITALFRGTYSKCVSGQLKAYTVVNGGRYVSNTSTVSLPCSGEGSVTLTIADDLVNRWWPNGYGEQTLYTLSVEAITPHEVSTRYLNVGFRTVELVQEPLIQGLSFYFKINDVPIFAKGSNWIPSSVFPELSADEKTIRHLLKSAKTAHMNMLRVWGGGFYESDLFYQIADEYGIMIWQDFMFACAMYPTTKNFLESVREEVKQNVMRLQHHPSIVLWAGNNENEVALYGNWYGTGDTKIYKDDYIKLYVDTIKTEVEKIDKTRPFVVSSPSDGLYTEAQHYLGPDPYSNLYGDVHYYNYVNDGWDINQYPRTRFASEYGVQSIPSMRTLRDAVQSSDDLMMNSTFMKHRQHLLGGYEFMEHLVSKNLIIPRTNSPMNDMNNYIYLTQINQAVSIKVQTEFYRQARSEVNTLGEGMTMGALYWQLNDVWQAPSWSSIEFGGQWKMLHYYAVDFFAPIIITTHVSTAKEVQLYIVSDKLAPIKNCSFILNVYRWNSLASVHSKSFTGTTIPANAAKMVASFWLDEFLQQADCGSLPTMRRNCVIEIMLKDENEKRIAPYNYIYPAPLKFVSLPSVNITTRVIPIPHSGTNSHKLNFAIKLKSNGIALFVWLQFESKINGQFSENGFHMFHGTKTAIFHSDEPMIAAKVRRHLRVHSLSDIYKQ